MTESSTELVYIEPISPSEAVVIGELDMIERVSRSSEPVPENFTRALRAIAGTAPEIQGVVGALSTRTVKLTRESMEAIRKYGTSSAGNGAFYGVVRGADGSIAEHLTFVDAAQAGALAASLPTLAGAVAMQLQQANIERKLDEIKEEIDYLRELAHDQTWAKLRATLGQLERVYRISIEVNELDDDHWQLVANLAQPVHELHELTDSRLRSLRELLDEQGGSLPNRVRLLNRALKRDRTLQWLEAHVHAELALVRWQVLYLMREADKQPELLKTLVRDFEEDRRRRHAELQELANGIARYLHRDSHLNSLLDRIRIISRFRLDRLLLELEDLLNVYRYHLSSAGLGQAELGPARVAGELPPSQEVEVDREWRELIGGLRKVPARVRPVLRSVGEQSAAMYGRVRDRTPRSSHD